MGSAATADTRVMRTVFGVLSRSGTLLSGQPDHGCDRRRAGGGGGFGARRPSARVLDDDATPPPFARSSAELLRRARREGSAIAIGHPYPTTLAVLEDELPGLAKEGIRVVRVTELVK